MSKKDYKVNPKYTPFGGFLEKKEKDDQDRPQYYIKIDQNVDVRVNGKKVTALNIQRPTDKFERQLAKGTISEEQFEQKMAEFEKGGDKAFVKFELTVNLDDSKK
jgi:hypothetical protein